MRRFFRRPEMGAAGRGTAKESQRFKSLRRQKACDAGTCPASSAPMKLAVLNPKGRDAELHFADGAGAPRDESHAPVNFHAFAACTGGGFFRDDRAIPAKMKSVLLLLRHDLKASRQALMELRRAGKTVVVSFKEAGAFQIAALLAKPDNLTLFREICARADAAIATTDRKSVV